MSSAGLLQSRFAPRSARDQQELYGVFFDEGGRQGYLLIDFLFQGAYSTTMLVLSLDDHKIYVRKLHNAQEFNALLTVQSADESNAVNQSHIPRLMASTYFQREIPEQSVSYRGQAFTTVKRYVTPATIWQFCNGPPLQNIFEWWSTDSDRIPEPVIWNFLDTILETLLHIHQQGISHSDIHGHNLILHFPGTSPLPELCLIDFGISKRWPSVADPSFNTPWTGTFDQSGNLVNTTLSDDQTWNMKIWYASAVQDMKDTLRFFLDFLVAGTDYADTDDDGFLYIEQYISNMLDRCKRAASRNEEVNGYSSELSKAIVAWSNILENLVNNPPQLRSHLLQLQAEVRAFAQPQIQNWQADARRAYRSTRWMRHLAPVSQTKPAIWRDPTRLLTPEPRRTPSRRRRLDESAIEVELDATDPIVRVEGGTMDGTIHLRQGHFQVVKLAYDNNTGRYSIIRRLDSLDAPSNFSSGGSDNQSLLQPHQTHHHHDVADSPVNEPASPEVQEATDAESDQDIPVDHTTSSPPAQSIPTPAFDFINRWAKYEPPTPQTGPQPVAQRHSRRQDQQAQLRRSRSPLREHNDDQAEEEDDDDDEPVAPSAEEEGSYMDRLQGFLARRAAQRATRGNARRPVRPHRNLEDLGWIDSEEQEKKDED